VPDREDSGTLICFVTYNISVILAALTAVTALAYQLRQALIRGKRQLMA